MAVFKAAAAQMRSGISIEANLAEAEHLIREAGYDESGRNDAIQNAVNGSGKIAGTNVTVTAIS